MLKNVVLNKIWKIYLNRVIITGLDTPGYNWNGLRYKYVSITLSFYNTFLTLSSKEKSIFSLCPFLTTFSWKLCPLFERVKMGQLGVSYWNPCTVTYRWKGLLNRNLMRLRKEFFNKVVQKGGIRTGLTLTPINCTIVLLLPCHLKKVSLIRELW